jgi:hypothetical protein
MPANPDNLLTALAAEINARIRLVHHIPGRLRLKLDASLADHPQRESLKHWLPNHEVFALDRFNLLTQTALIRYNTAIIPPELIEELFKADNFHHKKDILTRIKARTF